MPDEALRRCLRLGQLASLAALFAAGTAVAAEAAKEVTVVVMDEGGAPIPNAWVRVPDTEGRRMVDPTTGAWTASMMYKLDGSELVFEKGLVLDMTISAPGYKALTVLYTVGARRNVVKVELEEMEQAEIVEDNDELMIQWFTREEHEVPTVATPEEPPPPSDPRAP